MGIANMRSNVVMQVDDLSECCDMVSGCPDGSLVF